MELRCTAPFLFYIEFFFPVYTLLTSMSTTVINKLMIIVNYLYNSNLYVDKLLIGC